MELQFTKTPTSDDMYVTPRETTAYDPAEGIEYFNADGESMCPHGVTSYFFPKIASNPDTHYCKLLAFHTGSHTGVNYNGEFEWSTPHHGEEDNSSDCPICWGLLESNYFAQSTNTIRKAGIKIMGDEG